jgi:uncharacterized membrane protein
MAKAALVVVALIHAAFFWRETWAWASLAERFQATLPTAADRELALARNMGLYNLFLAVGLLLSALHPVRRFGAQAGGYLLACVVIAGVYGFLTVGSPIFLLVQTLPGAVALLAVVLQARRAAAGTIAAPRP